MQSIAVTYCTSCWPGFTMTDYELASGTLLGTIELPKVKWTDLERACYEGVIDLPLKLCCDSMINFIWLVFDIIS